ncbi:hypothetical protein D9619_013453 [Psilocybe cf. subviscida]|uniref:Uncharacterized protein n=1 Tax=Psilocybe cf. subviscida TaxID=2480587 RepID=A0A8H5BTP3_9AGAR|nr:hypothetical protein D9619_013453 [Psilocybe cf. subviscida]
MMRNGNSKPDVNLTVYAPARGGLRLEFVDIDVDVDDDMEEDTHRDSPGLFFPLLRVCLLLFCFGSSFS